MTPERWRDIERIYHQARARPPQGRAAFVREASAGDEALRVAVESLLARREEAGGFMEPPAGE